MIRTGFRLPVARIGSGLMDTLVMDRHVVSKKRVAERRQNEIAARSGRPAATNRRLQADTTGVTKRSFMVPGRYRLEADTTAQDGRRATVHRRDAGATPDYGAEPNGPRRTPTESRCPMETNQPPMDQPLMVQPPLSFSRSKKPSSLRARTGCCSLRMALASTWRTRSRVTLKILPTSSSV